jgi:hypothetical protein
MPAAGEEPAWTLERGGDPVAGAWCLAEIADAAGQRFGLLAWADGTATLYLSGAGWPLPPGRVSLSVDIDDKRWAVEAAAVTGAVAVPLDGNAAAGLFLTELAAGRALAITRDGAPVARFPLGNARATLEALAVCRDSLLGGRWSEAGLPDHRPRPLT